jgi:hypothetical protein
VRLGTPFNYPSTQLSNWSESPICIQITSLGQSPQLAICSPLSGDMKEASVLFPYRTLAPHLSSQSNTAIASTQSPLMVQGHLQLLSRTSRIIGNAPAVYPLADPGNEPGPDTIRQRIFPHDAVKSWPLFLYSGKTSSQHPSMPPAESRLAGIPESCNPG